MDSHPASALPDYDQLAATLYRYLMLIVPVSLAALDRLPALPEGAQAP